jgi:outer membrane protein assembly factor BamB
VFSHYETDFMPTSSFPRGAASALVFVCLALAAASASAQEWTRFRGPNGSGQSEASIPAQWSDGDINWKAQLPGGGNSSPVLWGDKIFLTSADTKAGERFVLCLSARDGHLLWKKSYPYSKYHIHLQNSFATSTPAVDADRVYIVWSTPERSTLYALSHSGDEVWHRELGSFTSQHGFASSPIVYQDLVIIGDEQDGPNPEAGGNPDAASLDGRSFLWALDRGTGEVRWKTPRKSTIVSYATPCVYQPDGGKPELIYNSRSHGMSAIDPATGKVNWELPLFDRRTVGSPILAGGLLIGACGVGSGNNTVYAVRPDGGSLNPQMVYKIDKSSASYVPTPVAAGDLVFIWNDRGIVTCIDGPTGKIHWRQRIGGDFFGSPVRAGDKVFCTSLDGDVVVLAAADKYQLLAKNPLGETSRATPAIAGGRMYVRTESHLVSIGAK